MSTRQKPITTPNEVAAFTLPEGRTKARRPVKSKHGSGLALEVRADRETKAWLYRFRVGGRQHEMQLGAYPAESLKQARELHAAAVALVRRGIDPRKHRAAEKASNAARWTMGDAFAAWIEHYATAPGRSGEPPTARTVAKQRGRWNRHLAPRLARYYVGDVSRREIIAVLNDVAAEAREEARQCLTLLRGLLGFCEDQEQIDTNPAAGIRPDRIRATPRPSRERHLNVSELRALWQALEESREAEGLAVTARLDLPVVAAIKLLVLTGARRGELAGMRWAEIDGSTWTIPAERAKSRRSHSVFLSKQALNILEEQKAMTSGEFVFESLRNNGKPIHRDSITTAVARLQGRSRKEHDTDAPLNNLTHFTVHDLRRSCATQWTELCGADHFLVEAMLSHAPPKLIGTYNKAKRWKMQVEIWRKWSELVAELIANDPGDNVIPLHG